MASKFPSSYGRSVPTYGLSTPQINIALQEMGYSPIIYDFSIYNDQERWLLRPEEIIYRYIESGLPVILGIKTRRGGHAVVVCGHSFAPDLWWPLVREPYYGPIRQKGYEGSFAWVENFIIHDDNLSPYLFMPKEFIGSAIICIIVALPRGVFMRAEEAESYSFAKIMERNIVGTLKSNLNILENSEEFEGFWLKEFLHHLDRKKLILRTFLSKKEHLLQQIQNVKNPYVRIYEKIELPSYLWITEVSFPEIFCQQRL